MLPSTFNYHRLMESWNLWLDENRDPYLNMAIDEQLLSETGQSGKPCLRFYGWDRPSISIGYIQRYSSAEKEGYAIVRRPTGGGIVCHDSDLTYTVVIPSGHHIWKLNRQESYYVFHRIIICALREMKIPATFVSSSAVPKDRMSMKCFSAPVRYDVALTNPDGSAYSKAAGAAQRRTRNGILHQGSIVIEAMNKNRKELTDRIVEFFSGELNTMFDIFIPAPDFIERARALASAKYSLDSWNKMR